jgi:hypothetical protein
MDNGCALTAAFEAAFVADDDVAVPVHIVVDRVKTQLARWSVAPVVAGIGTCSEFSPLSLAIDAEWPIEIVHAMITEFGCDVNGNDRPETHPLMNALASHRRDCVALFLKYGAHPNNRTMVPTSNGIQELNALMYALMLGSPLETVVALLKAGAVTTPVNALVRDHLYWQGSEMGAFMIVMNRCGPQRDGEPNARAADLHHAGSLGRTRHTSLLPSPCCRRC